jgi:signal peptidase II
VDQTASQKVLEPAIGRSMRKYYFSAAALIVLLDQLTKWLVSKEILLHDQLTIIPGFFSLTHRVNPGAAFGLFSDSDSPWRLVFLVLFSTVAMCVVSVLLWKNGHLLTTTGVGLALILGGAIGNLWDRIIAGHVVDFLLFYIGSYQWPAFNVADSAIVVGAVLVMGEIVFAKHKNL